MTLVALIVVVWLCGGWLLWRYIEQKDVRQRQLQRYTLLNVDPGNEPGKASWHHWSWYQNLQTFISQDKLRKSQYAMVAALLVGPVVLNINGMDWYAAVPLTTVSVVLVVWFAYQQLQQQAMDHFRNELPDVIDGLIRALRVGAPMVDVFHEMAEQHQGVTARLFERMHDELTVGQTLAEVMKNAAQRMPIAEFRFLTIVLSLQQETGGRLTEVLGRLSHTLRARAELSASIQTITAESRNSAKVLAALPVLVCLVLFSTGREHFDFLMTSGGGQLVMMYVVGSILSGLFLIHRMTQLKG